MHALKSLIVALAATTMGLAATCASAQVSAPAPGATAPAAGAPGAAAPGRAGRGAPRPLEFGWSPKKNPYDEYVAPNKVWWKLSDVLAAHSKTGSWQQAVVRNKDLEADWHQLANS